MKGLIVLNEFQVATLKEYYGDGYEKKVTKKVKKYINKMVAKADDAIDAMYEELDGLEVEVDSWADTLDKMSDEEKTKFFDNMADKINSECNKKQCCKNL